MFTATYSPEDNKLRLYATSRLDPELYARVRAAGFIWAPKQDLFVAPMWTPEREDLLIELAGEIGDEDTSLVDRAEERAERFEDYRDSRKADAEAAHKAVSAIADGIPLGQPILVGHHSERHARRDAEKIENGMRRAVKMWRTSEYWQQRAKGAIRHAKYKERPDVRARRIKKIEADLRKQRRYISDAETFTKFWTRGLEREQAGTFELTKERAMAIANHDPGWGYNLWSDLRDDKITPAEARDRAIKNHARTIAHASRWAEHYENRLTYERAMLADAGGTVADKTGPEKGGACKCWASPRGGWSYIQKVNKVSVTVLDNWGNGGGNFTRTIPFDKLAGVMSKAEVDAARAEGRLIESADATGFYISDAAPVAKPAATKEPDPQAETFEAMAQTLKAGVKVVSAPQLFPTPATLAERVRDLADIGPGMAVLEPSAGTGALLSPLFNAEGTSWLVGDSGRLVAIEVNHELAKRLRAEYAAAEVICADFLEVGYTDFAPGIGIGKFDRIIMNPPFVKGADIKHIQHARRFLKPGGKLVAICAAGPRQRDAFESEGDWIDLPAGSFESAGTNVNTAIVILGAVDAAEAAA